MASYKRKCGVRVGQALPYGTFAVYNGDNDIVEVVTGVDRREANAWAERNVGPDAYVMENPAALDLRYER